ncbi:MAG: hypothetical protein JSV91_16170 [Phycisphaerales bacterium]|nr:MAG: hypothetical protein JSV91_16170 [Phycisphaerales bacterium]
MSGYHRLCNAAYWLALTIWVSVLVSAFVARIAAFSILTDLPVTIDGFPAHEVAVHGQIAAEKVMEPILTFVDLGQLAAAVIVLVAVVLQRVALGTSFRSPAVVTRIVCLSLATILLVLRVAVIMPGMNRTLRAYWEAVQLAEAETVRQHRDALDSTQPIATWLLAATLALLLITVVTSPAALTARSAPDSPRLERPALLERGQQR